MCSHVKPMPPRTWIDRSQAATAASVAYDFPAAVAGAGAGPERPVERRRPAHLARDALGQLLGAERRQSEPDGREVRPGVQRAPELLEQQRLLDEAETRTAVLLRHRDAEPAELGELAPGARVPAFAGVGELGDALRREALREIRPPLGAELLLLVGEGEIHQRPLRRP